MSHLPVILCVDLGIDKLFAHVLVVKLHLLHNQLHGEQLTIAFACCATQGAI